MALLDLFRQALPLPPKRSAQDLAQQKAKEAAYRRFEEKCFQLVYGTPPPAEPPAPAASPAASAPAAPAHRPVRNQVPAAS